MFVSPVLFWKFLQMSKRKRALRYGARLDFYYKGSHSSASQYTLKYIINQGETGRQVYLYPIN
jgi:hypothetical protein